MKTIAVMGLIALAAGPAAAAREPLGLFNGWAAFRDATPPRCYAIAEPVDAPAGGQWRPFAAIGHWPGRQIRGQFHIRLRAAKQTGVAVTLAIDDQHFTLVSGGADAWTPRPSLAPDWAEPAGGGAGVTGQIGQVSLHGRA